MSQKFDPLNQICKDCRFCWDVES